MENEQVVRTAAQLKRAKINRVSIVDQVCASIKQDIAAGTWKEGERIPTEAEFAELFGVNRLSVRMALQKLSTLGIIETRVGEGSFVKHFSLKPVLSEIAVFYADDEKLHEVQQLRNLMEGECMNLAIINASEQEKTELKEILERYNECAGRYNADCDNPELLEEMVEADFAFHYKVVKMSHNSLYKDVYYMVQQLIRSHITQLISTRVHRRKEKGLDALAGDDTHSQIYEGIINADVEETRKAREEILGILPIHGLDVFD